MLKRFYLVCAIIGAIVPWIFFTQFFIEQGFDIPLFVESLFANPVAAGFVVDLLISAVVFLVWSFSDAQKIGLGHWWVVLLATFLVGLSLALPLYLYLREDALQVAGQP